MRGLSAAVAADRMHDRLLALARTGPPRKRNPALAGTSNRAKFVNNSDYLDSTATKAAQRAIRGAVLRAASLERRAAIAETIGLRDASLRFASIAATIRGEVLA
jgi:hypothetical protein